MIGNDQQLTPEEAARVKRLVDLCEELEAELSRLEKAEKELRVRVLKAVDKEKMKKISKFIEAQSN